MAREEQEDENSYLISIWSLFVSSAKDSKPPCQVTGRKTSSKQGRPPKHEGSPSLAKQMSVRMRQWIVRRYVGG